MLFLSGISGSGTLTLIQYVIFCRYGVLKREKIREDRDMKKRIVSLLLALVLAATLLPVQAWGATVVDSGYCGGEGDGKTSPGRWTATGC